jgi:hypothetical protein
MGKPLRYLVTLATLPDEASWCTCEDLASLRQKLKELWLLHDPVCKYYVGSGSTSIITVSNMVTEDEFQLWLHRDEEGVPHPLSNRLIAYDRVNEVQLQHSSEAVSIPKRPLISLETIGLVKGSISLRHSTLNEVIILNNAPDSLSWGLSVRRVQEAWNAVRPLFRYVDESTGERVTVNILDAGDFTQWLMHGRAISCELVCYEHGAEAIVAERRKARNIERLRVQSGIPLKDSLSTSRPESSSKNWALVDQSAGSSRGLVVLPELNNKFSAAKLEEQRLAKGEAPPTKTEAERHFEKLKLKV